MVFDCLCLQEKECENAYFKMDNVLIDDRRIHVDFSQSVAKVKWKGKGDGRSTDCFVLRHLKLYIVHCLFLMSIY